ncbi:hypothetical protein VB773_15490 [Haloarculaceae archaeon H-GB2-1]|nr:hypothetical protein [Haloarculaceae archaeon H-GB1-1]MEA5387361.1 hypothetical protein [Haloarculaceae archaeon H-GB11]MEA5408830.1 hypothetical protein [Haloarculaceae archaeon H-GB2-1]
MVGFDLRTLTAVFAVVLMGIALLALSAGNIQVAGLSFLSVSLLIYGREQYL